MVDNPTIGMRVITNNSARIPGQKGKVVCICSVGVVGVDWDDWEYFGGREDFINGYYTIHRDRLDFLGPAIRTKSGFSQFITQQGL